MAERDYAAELPKTPPEGLLPWLKEQGMLKVELLIYRMGSYYDPLTEQNVRAVQLTCTACGEKIFTEKAAVEGCHAACAPAPFGFVHPETKEHLISGGHCLCPACGAETEIRHINSVTERQTSIECYPLTISRLEEKLLLAGWCVRKWFTKGGESGITSWPYEAYVVEKKGIVRLNAYRKFITTVSLTGVWEQRKQYRDTWGRSELVFPWDPTLLEGSTAENSKLDLLIQAAGKDGTHPVSYLRLWLKCPQVENLVVQGAAALLSGMLRRERDLYRYCGGGSPPAIPALNQIDWKQKSPFKMLGTTKDEFRRCVRENWDLDTLVFWREEKERGRTLSSEELALAKHIGYFDCRRLRDVGRDYLKTARYLQKQTQKDRRCDIRILWDYWRIAEGVGENLALPTVCFPPQLMRAHDRVEQVRKWREEAKREVEREARKTLFAERFEVLSALSWEWDGISIRPVRDEDELRREGDALKHCVGSYAQRHVEGKTAIFLIRRTNAPDKPWYTLELNEKTLAVAQNRGKHNCERTKKVTEFELRWVSHLREITEQKKKRVRVRAGA